MQYKEKFVIFVLFLYILFMEQYYLMVEREFFIGGIFIVFNKNFYCCKGRGDVLFQSKIMWVWMLVYLIFVYLSYLF